MPTSTLKDLAAEFNNLLKYTNDPKFKSVKRFASRAAAEKRIAALQAHIQSLTPKKAVSENKTTDPRYIRNAVEVDGIRYKSVKAAFVALGLPLEKHQRFRKQLKEVRVICGHGLDWEIIPAKVEE